MILTNKYIALVDIFVLYHLSLTLTRWVWTRYRRRWRLTRPLLLLLRKEQTL